MGGSVLARIGLAWSNRSLRTKGLIVVAIPLITLLVVAPLYYLSGRRSQDSEAGIRHTLLVRNQIQHVLVSMLNAETGVRGYLASGQDSFLQPYLATQDTLQGNLNRLTSLVEGDPSQVTRLRTVDSLTVQELSDLEALRQLAKRGGVQAARKQGLLTNGKATMDQLRGVLAAMGAEEYRLAASRQAAADRADRSALATVVGGTLLGLVGGLLAMMLFLSSVVRRVRQSRENALRLERGLELLPSPTGKDEINQLGNALEEAGTLLTERQTALAISEERYRTLARNFPNGAVAMFDRDLRYTLMEGSVLPAIGLSREHFEGKTIWESLEPDVARSVEGTYRAALRGESSVSEVSSRGREYFVQVVPAEGAGGDITGGMLVALDITERKQAEEEVRRAEAFLDSIVENIPNMVFVKEAESLRFMRFNRAGEELLGHPREELIGKNDYDFFPKEEADSFTAKDREVLERGTLADIAEEPVETRDRGVRILHTKKIPIQGPDGRPRYLLGISEDITERKQVEEELHRAKDEAERANGAKDEFLSRMSHELRTPLNAVLGFAQILEMEDLAPQNGESVDQILKAGRHLLGLIDEVLDISRIASGKLSLSAEPVAIGDALQEAVDLVQPLAAARDIQLHAEDANGLHVLADRQRLKQVLLNLLSNGVKYNRDGGAVAVTWEMTTKDTIQIRVADTGTGIAPEVMPRLFAPFDRLGAEATDVEGTGLGLALSKALVEAMGGTMKAESRVGSGSVFVIELRVAEPPVDRFEREDRWGNDVRDVAAETHTILYIEDNLSNLRLIERVLEGRVAVRLLSAMQGQLGLDIAREHLPDLILLDVHLPDMSGEEALRRLRANPVTQEIPVVVVSADATPGQIKRLLTAGAQDYLTKPLDVKRFLHVLDDILIERRRDHVGY